MKTALQFSGGKDSLVTLFLAEPVWDELTVLWCDAGDVAPEVHALMTKVEHLVPHFVRIEGRVKEIRELFGDPTTETWFDCCMSSISLPMLKWVFDNKIECVVKGTRKVDHLIPPSPYEKHLGVVYFAPIWDWTDSQMNKMLEYIKSRGFEPVYPHDCLHCPVLRPCDRPELRNIHETALHTN